MSGPTVSRRAAVTLGFWAVLGRETTDAAKKKPRKRRRECRKGRLHCAGRCYRRRRTTCCREGTGTMPYPRAYQCCYDPDSNNVDNDRDVLGGACPPEYPVCCQGMSGGRLERQCASADSTCCPIVAGDAIGSACPPDSPTCCQWFHDGEIGRICGPAGDVCCPAIDAEHPGGGCPPASPVCCYLPSGGWTCDPPGSTCEPAATRERTVMPDSSRGRYTR